MGAPRVALPVLALCLLAADVATSWAARPQPVGRAGRVQMDVAVAGDSVVWGWSEGRYAEPTEIRIASPGTPPATLLQGEITPGTAVEQFPVLDASAHHVVAGFLDFVRSESTVHVVAASAWTGPPAGPLERMGTVTAAEWPVDAELDGHRAALLIGHRTRERRRLRLVIRDLRTGREINRWLSHRTGISLGFAGHYVATTQPNDAANTTRILVRDTRTWQVQTRAKVPDDDVEIALRRDGTVFFMRGFLSHRAGVIARGGRPRRVQIRAATLSLQAGRRGATFLQQLPEGRRLVEGTASGRVVPLTAPIRGLVGFARSGGGAALRTHRCIYLARVPALGTPLPCEG